MLETDSIGRKAGDEWLIQDVSITISGGERLAIVGPSGSGKTVLLRALALLDPIDAGVIRWHGQTVSGPAIPDYRSRVAYLHQRPALFEGTVEDNLRQPFSLGLHHRKRFDRERLLGMLNSLGRGAAFLNKRDQDLSGGESQLAAVLRAVQLDPEYLLLDEPTAALDAESASSVEQMVLQWMNEQPDQRALVWVTHDATQPERIGASIYRMRQGHLQGGHLQGDQLEGGQLEGLTDSGGDRCTLN